MHGLGEHLQGLNGRVCLMCIGNGDGGDDAFGVQLGEELATQGMPNVIIAGVEPERLLFRGAADGFDHLIFVDAIDVGAAPGSVVFLDASEMAGRFPQVSTHRLSLGLLAQWVQSRGTTRVWLLGVQPQSLQGGQQLSPVVQATLAALRALLQDCFAAEVKAC